MRTLMLTGIVAGSLIGAAHASTARAQDAAPALDYGAPGAPDDKVYTGYADRVPSEVDYRGGETPPATPDAVYSGRYDAHGRWTGNGEAPDGDYAGSYDADGRWTGTWDGTYESPDGRLYQGHYQGTVEGRPGVGYAPPPPAPGAPGTYYSTTYPGGGQGYGYAYGPGASSPGYVTITTRPPVVTETVETTTETYYY